MPKTFFWCMSLKTGAGVMAGINFFSASFSILSAIVALHHQQDDEDRLNLIMMIILGVYNAIVGGVMISALIKGSERAVLLYILLEFVNIFIVTVFSAINIFEYKSLTRSASLTGIVIGCFVLWYGLYCMVSFYNELAQYNNTVKSGIIEYSATSPNIHPVMFPEKAVESTFV